MPTLTTTPQSGFTLLELVIVMFIIGLIASTPLLFIDNQDEQLRYEETLQKMELIRRALYQRESYNNQPILSGFVVDNGTLPPSEDFEGSPSDIDLAPLINRTAEFDGSISESWLDYSGWQLIESTLPRYITSTVSGALPTGFEQLKGYRGRYINQGLDSSNDLKDGWGGAFIIDSSSGAGSYQYDASNAYRSVTRNLTSNQWQVSLADLNITLVNDLSVAINAPVAVLVFRNVPTALATPSTAWTTYYFNASVVSGASVSSNIATWNKNDSGLLTTFQAQNEKIPAGDHLVIFDVDASQAPSAMLRVIPGATQPTLTLTVSP